jgi:hypothetical protein
VLKRAWLDALAYRNEGQRAELAAILDLEREAPARDDAPVG